MPHAITRRLVEGDFLETPLGALVSCALAPPTRISVLDLFLGFGGFFSHKHERQRCGRPCLIFFDKSEAHILVQCGSAELPFGS